MHTGVGFVTDRSSGLADRAAYGVCKVDDIGEYRAVEHIAADRLFLKLQLQQVFTSITISSVCSPAMALVVRIQNILKLILPLPNEGDDPILHFLLVLAITG